MDRRALRTLVLTGLGVVAVAWAASTLTAVQSGQPGGGTPDRADPGVIETSVDVPHLRTILTVVTVVALLVTLVYLLQAARDREEILELVRILAAVLLAVVVLYAVLTVLAGHDVGLDENAANATNGTGGSGGGTGPGAGAPSAPTLTVVALVALLVVGTVVVLVASRGVPKPDVDDTGSEEESHTREVHSVGLAAGRAADRIESDADVDNEIYRAWKEMTDPLEVASPATSTPREFAAAAIEAGMDPEDVDALTRLFEDVRYGGRPITDERETRAIDVLRRIESTYAEEP